MHLCYNHILFFYFPGNHLALKAGMMHKLTHTSPRKEGGKKSFILNEKYHLIPVPHCVILSSLSLSSVLKVIQIVNERQ